jgi:hypothetical protein
VFNNVVVVIFFKKKYCFKIYQNNMYNFYFLKFMHQNDTKIYKNNFNNKNIF